MRIVLHFRFSQIVNLNFSHARNEVRHIGDRSPCRKLCVAFETWLFFFLHDFFSRRAIVRDPAEIHPTRRRATRACRLSRGSKCRVRIFFETFDTPARVSLAGTLVPILPLLAARGEFQPLATAHGRAAFQPRALPRNTGVTIGLNEVICQDSPVSLSIRGYSALI